MENKLGMDPNIIDVEGIEIESISIPILEGDEVGMDSRGWTRMPSSMDVETGERSFANGVIVKEVKKEKKCYPIVTKIIFLGILIGTLAKEQDKIINLYNNNKDILTKFKAEKNITEEADYDAALAEAGAIVEEHEEKEEAPQIEEGAIDEVIGGKVLAFTDPYDDDQVYARAEAIYIYLQKSNVMDVTIEELSDQIKFVNGTYNAETDDEAWDMFNETARTFSLLRTASAQSFHFAGGLVDNNGVHIALGYDAWLPDNTKNSDFMEKSSLLFENLLTATTMEEMVDASKMFLKLEADLKEGVLETPNGTKLDCNSLTDAEFYIFYQKVQTANLIIYNTLGEDATITYTDNIGEEVKVTLKTLDYYYNPQCDYENEEYSYEDVTESKFAKCTNNLVQTAINKRKILTPSR